MVANLWHRLLNLFDEWRHPKPEYPSGPLGDLMRYGDENAQRSFAAYMDSIRK